MQKKLILFTSDFPFGKGETFLETEIEYLAKGFDHVLIVSLNTRDSQTRKIPDNCSTLRIDVSFNSVGKFMSLFGIFNPILLEELNIVRKKYRKKVSKGIINTMLISLRRASMIKKHVLGLIENSAETYFYSYWCDDVAIGLAMAAAENKNIKTFCRIHRWDVYFEGSKINYLPYRYFITSHLNAIFSISNDGMEYAKNNWATGKKSVISISRLGIKNVRLFEKSPLAPFLIVSCSTIIPLKRVDLIAKSLKSIPELPIKWIHIGEGPEKEKVLDIINELPSNIVAELKGFVENTSIYSFYEKQKPDLFINLSSSEGIPVSIMEAMSFGIPVIATDVGGNKEIVNQKNGYLVPEDVTTKSIREIIEIFYRKSPQEKAVLKNGALQTWKTLYNADINYPSFVSQIKSL